jgi:hypothetical protein
LLPESAKKFPERHFEIILNPSYNFDFDTVVTMVSEAFSYKNAYIPPRECDAVSLKLKQDDHDLSPDKV